MSKLHISDDLSLPTDAVTQAMAFLGRRGQGKSYAATKMAELFHGVGAQFVAMDPVGIWFGLRLSSDGKGDGLKDVPIFGGLHGDIPIEASSGAMLADVVADRGVSAVLDVSQFESDMDKARFARDFGARFFYRKKAAPSAVHIFIEEAQEFVPQNPQKGEEQMLHAWQRIVRLGRNYGIGASMISQRPQDVNKKALNQAECLFCFQLLGPQERKAVEGWVSDKGLNDDLSSILPHLKTGHAHVWSPVWLGISREVKIAAKETFPAGSTPKVGQRPVESRPLAPLELEKLRKDMAATIEKAKADDPKHLRAELARLRADLAKAQNAKPAPAEPKIVEKPVVTDQQVKSVEDVVTRMEREGQRRIDAAEKFCESVDALRQTGEELRNTGREFAAALRSGREAPPLRPVIQRPASRPADNFRRAVPVRLASTGDGTVDGPGQKILNALSWWEAVGVNQPTIQQVGAVAQYSPNGGSFSTYLSRLSGQGLIERGRGEIRLTDSGRERAEPLGEPPTLDELHDRIRAVLDGPGRKIIDVVIAAGADGQLTVDEVGEASGYSAAGGSFSTYLSRLSGLGLIERGRGIVRPSEVLFPPSLVTQ